MWTKFIRQRFIWISKEVNKKVPGKCTKNPKSKIYENLKPIIQQKKWKVLIAFDNMIADMEAKSLDMETKS